MYDAITYRKQILKAILIVADRRGLKLNAKYIKHVNIKQHLRPILLP